MNEPKVMKMLHEIRAKHYEQTKNLKPEEFIDQIHKEAESVKRRILEKQKKQKA